MSNNIELLSNTENFTIGTNSNLSEILANVVRIGTDVSNVTISIPQDISSSYNLILPVRQGASGESLTYGADGQLKWHDTTVLKQVISVYGSTLTGNLISTTGTHDSPTYLDAYIANITPKSENSKIFVQFKVNYHAALSASNQISFFIKKIYDGSETLFSETMFGPYNAAGGYTGQYISNLVDEASTSSSISYQLGYQINGLVDLSDTLGILGYDGSYNNTIVLQEFEGSGSNATSVWNKGADSNGLYYNDGTVHIGSTKDALGSQNTSGVALELSGNLVGTNATFSGNIYAHAFHVQEAHVGPNTLFIGGIRVLNQNEHTGSVNVYTDQIVSESVNGLTIEANGNIILDPSGTGTIQLNGDVQLSNGNINAETFIGDLSGNVNAITIAATTTTTNNLSLDGTLTTSNSTSIEGNLIPSANITYDLGSSTHMWRDVYVGPGSLYVNNKKVIEDNSDTINITTDEGQNLKIKTSGDGGQLQIQSEMGGIVMSKSGATGDITITTSSGGDINMTAYDNVQITAGDDLQLTSTTGTIQLKSAVNITNGMTVSNPTGDDIKIDDNLQITGQVKTNEIIEYTTNSGVTIENVLIKDGNVSGNLLGNVTGIVSSLSNHTTDVLTEGSTNKYYSDSLVDLHLEGGTGVTYSNGSISIGQSVGTNDNVQFNNVTIDGTLNSDDITGTNVTVSNDLVVSGNLIVNGTRTIVNATTLDIGDNKIVVNAGGSTTDAGIIANVSGTEHEFVYSTNNNAWGTTGDLNIGGNVIGNLVGAMTMTGHIIPLTANTFDIGSPDKQIRDIYVSNNSIYFGEDTTLSVDETSRELKVRKRNKDVIPKAIRDANPSITNDDILTATFGAGHGKQLSDLTLGHYRRYARNNLTIGSKSSDNIEIADIFTNDAENWEEDISLETVNNTLTQIQENMNISGNLTVGGNITSTSGYFIGDGSQLTGINEDQTVTITGNGATTVSGTYPNFTISSTDTDTNTTYSAGTGMSLDGTTFSIGQAVAINSNVQFNNVTIDGTLNSDDITGTNVTVSNDLVVSGNLTVNGTHTGIIPSQTSNSGKFLTTDGTTLSWVTSSTIPDQTNNSGKFLTTDGTTTSWGNTFTELEVTEKITVGTSDLSLYTEESKDYIFKNSIISTSTVNGNYRIIQTDTNNEFVIVAQPLSNGHKLYTRFNNSVVSPSGNLSSTASNRIGQAHISDRGTDGYVEIIIGDAEYDSRGTLHFYTYRKDIQKYEFYTILQNIGIHFGIGAGWGSVLHGTEDNNMLFMIGDNTNTKNVIVFTRDPDKSWRETFQQLGFDFGSGGYETRHNCISKRDATDSTYYNRNNYHSFINQQSIGDQAQLSAFKWISSSRDGEFIVLNNPRLRQLYVFKKPENMYKLGDGAPPTNDVTELNTGYTVNEYEPVQVINAEDFVATDSSTPSHPRYLYGVGTTESGASIEGKITQHTIECANFSSQDDLLFGGAEEYNKVISPNGKVLALIDSGYKNSNATIYDNSNNYIVGIIVILERSSTEDSSGNYVPFTYSQHFIGEFYSVVSSTSTVTTQFGKYISVGNNSIIASSGHYNLTNEQNKMYYITKNESGTWTVDNIPGPDYDSETNGVIGKQIFGSHDHNSIVTSNGNDNGTKNPIYFYKDYNKSKVTSYNGEFTNVTAKLLNTAYAPALTSDDRYKINEQVINNGLESIRQLVPKRYLKTNKEYEANYTGNLDFGDKGKVETGLIAQEVNNIENLSYLVNYENNRYSLCYNDLFVYNIAATQELDLIVQQQKNEIDSLKEKNLDLENKIDILKNKLNELLSESGKETINF